MKNRTTKNLLEFLGFCVLCFVAVRFFSPPTQLKVKLSKSQLGYGHAPHSPQSKIEAHRKFSAWVLNSRLFDQRNSLYLLLNFYSKNVRDSKPAKSFQHIIITYAYSSL